MSKGVVRLTGPRRRILVALHDMPVEDPAGLAVHRLADRVGGWSGDALSALLARMDRHGLVERAVRGKRTYRLAITDLGCSVAGLPAPAPFRRRSVSVERMPDGPARRWGQRTSGPVVEPVAVGPAIAGAMRPMRPTPGAWARAEAPGSRATLAGSAGGSAKRLTRGRVEVLRALLGGGPIDDPAGHATRILMGRTGRTDLPATHTLVAGMVRAGLVRRTVRNRRVVHLEAIPDALSARDLRLVWSTAAFPIETTPAAPPGPATPAGRSMAEVEALRDELAATRAELARVRLQLEMFRAWAKRMPGLDPTADDLPPRTPATGRAKAATTRTSGDSGGDAGLAARPACQYVHPDSDPDQDRRGKPCELGVWEGSGQWCWHHDPTPIRRRRAPVRRVITPAA